MKKVLLFLAFLISGGVAFAQTATREIPVLTPKAATLQNMEQRLTYLKQSFEAKEASNIVVYESKTLDAMRQCIDQETNTAIIAEMKAIFVNFEGFTFYQATAEAAQPKFELLQRFVVLARN